ncbi:MAG: hypothetical protein HY718_00965 [Planctomycetes bacterium]|nr:hypothetical protein [Planctomycetota bacterium]
MALVLTGLLGVILLSGLLPEAQVAVLPAAFVPIVIYGLMTYRLERFVARVHSNDCEVCPQCGYVLHGLPVVHICPECSASYDITDVKRVWMEYFRSDRRYRL